MNAPKHNQEFRFRLEEAMHRAGIGTLKEFADLIGRSESTIKNLKQGLKFNPDTPTLIVQKLNEALDACQKPRITPEWLFGVWEEKPKDATKPQSLRGAPTGSKQKLLTLDEIPDLLTPGIAPRKMQEFYVKHLGSDLGKKLAARSKDIIIAVEKGDFVQQEELGLRIAQDAEEFPQIQAVGHYFAGEGIRLQGDIPIIGICRGMQFLNLFFGGSVFTNLSRRRGEPDHAGTPHEMELEGGPRGMLGVTGWQINSFHRHGVVEEGIAPDLRIVARAKGGAAIEGLLHPKRWILGLQWHPERPGSTPLQDDGLVNAFLNSGLT